MSQTTAGAAGDALQAQVMRAVQATLDAMSAHVALVDEAGGIIAVNHAWRLFAEREGAASDCVGLNYLDVCAATSEPAARQAAEGLSDVLAGAQSEFQLEYACHAPHERRWYQLRLIRCTSGEGLGAVIAHEDVTGRSEAHEQLGMQAALLNEVDAAVIVANLDYTVRIWSDGAERLYGWTGEQATGRDIRELFVAEPGLADRAVAALQAEGRWAGEFLGRRSDGSTFPNYGRQRLIRDPDGAPAAVVGFAIDISRRKERERAMEHARRYLQAITDSMGEGVFTLDPDGCLVYVNQAASAMLGWTLPAMSGRPIEALLGVPQPGDAAPGDCLLPMRRACHEGEVARVPDAVFTRADGVGLSVRYTASPLAGAHGVGGCVVVFEDITKARADDERMQRDVERLAWLGHVQEALSEDRFVLHAQPIADARTGEVVQRELLLRMLAPPSSNGAPALIAPGEYLPVAEEYGLIGEVDRWVVSRAAEIAARGIAVQCNVSGHSVSDPSFVDHIGDEVASHGADPATIVFEITETAIISDEPAARAFVERLHALGCKIALDDFGTGYGAFSYLKQLPIDYLKIDIEFVRDAGIDPASRGVVRAIVELARGIGISTVAEGVEDEETLILMRNLRVDYVQGFHIGRPAPRVTGEFGSQ